MLAGSSVIKVEATDHDDPREGQNAQLTYSLEKNVIDESSGSPILTIHTRTGLITTALCCLDREKTPQYEIQVVATDGGGLKGECLAPHTSGLSFTYSVISHTSPLHNGSFFHNFLYPPLRTFLYITCVKILLAQCQYQYTFI